MKFYVAIIAAGLSLMLAFFSGPPLWARIRSREDQDASAKKGSRSFVHDSYRGGLL
jgi:hypothetical protein